MTNPITTLTCPSCGGKLQISDKINRFACGYCGNEQIVHRESGIVYLEPIAEDVRHIRKGVENIQGGVDKTAAELAIVRLTKELATLEGELKSVMVRKSKMPNIEIALIIIGVLAFINAMGTRSPLAWLICLVCIVGFVFMWITREGKFNKQQEQRVLEIQADTSDTQDAIAKNRRLINS